jgi:hypothetical protein
VQQSFKKQRGAMKRKTIVLGLLLLACGCTATYRIDRYDLNKRYITEAGSPMVVREKCWGDSYYQAATSKNCILRQEIFYSGREGQVIHITYKEFVGENGNYSSEESFLQDVGYDLRQSDIISFRDITFKVMEASKRSIEFMVIDLLTYQPYPLY